MYLVQSRFDTFDNALGICETREQAEALASRFTSRDVPLDKRGRLVSVDIQVFHNGAPGERTAVKWFQTED